VFCDDLGAFRNGARLIVLPHSAQQLGIGAAVPEHVIAAGFDLVHDLRVVVADAAVQKDGGGSLSSSRISNSRQLPIRLP
jgi:hypothetical protein